MSKKGYNKDALKIELLAPDDENGIEDLIELSKERGVNTWDNERIQAFLKRDSAEILLAYTPDKQFAGFIAHVEDGHSNKILVEDFQIHPQLMHLDFPASQQRIVQNDKVQPPLTYDAAPGSPSRAGDHLLMHTMGLEHERAKLDFSKMHNDDALLELLKNWEKHPSIVFSRNPFLPPKPDNIQKGGVLHFTFLNPDDVAMVDSVSLLSDQSTFALNSTAWRRIARKPDNKVLVALTEDNKTVGYLHYVKNEDAYQIYTAHIGAAFNDFVFNKSLHTIASRKEPITIAPEKPQDAGFHMAMQLNMLVGSIPIDVSAIMDDKSLASVIDNVGKSMGLTQSQEETIGSKGVIPPTKRPFVESHGGREENEQTWRVLPFDKRVKMAQEALTNATGMEWIIVSRNYSRIRRLSPQERSRNPGEKSLLFALDTELQNAPNAYKELKKHIGNYKMREYAGYQKKVLVPLLKVDDILAANMKDGCLREAFQERIPKRGEYQKIPETDELEWTSPDSNLYSGNSPLDSDGPGYKPEWDKRKNPEYKPRWQEVEEEKRRKKGPEEGGPKP